ncbi:hypothetical protein [Devosia submarina]|uniref:hypothetical protein n=1 Tax=Devosia submarina TaxID=1173082 RepID=UPI000D3CFE39|nr:hypothetical protein [Devosia submarina]
MLHNTNYRSWEKPVLFEEVCFVELSEEEKYVLDLIVLGASELRIMWLTALDRASLRKIINDLEEKLGTDNLGAAGALLRDHDLLNPVSIGARLAETQLRVLTGARVLKPIVEGEHCGLHLFLANGTMVKAWICAHEEVDLPGFLDLQDDDGDVVDYEGISRLLADVHSAIGGTPTTPRLARHILADLVERALAIIDEIDGDSDLEPPADDEDDSDRWLNPVSLNPEYQREPIIVAVDAPSLPEREATSDNSAVRNDYVCRGASTAYEQEPYHHRDRSTASITAPPVSQFIQIQAPAELAPGTNATYVIEGLPPGPRLSLARKMIADFDGFVRASQSGLDERAWKSLKEYVDGMIGQLNQRSRHSPHHQALCEIIANAYYEILFD